MEIHKQQRKVTQYKSSVTEKTNIEGDKQKTRLTPQTSGKLHKVVLCSFATAYVVGLRINEDEH